MVFFLVFFIESENLIQKRQSVSTSRESPDSELESQRERSEPQHFWKKVGAHKLLQRRGRGEGGGCMYVTRIASICYEKLQSHNRSQYALLSNLRWTKVQRLVDMYHVVNCKQMRYLFCLFLNIGNSAQSTTIGRHESFFVSRWAICWHRKFSTLRISQHTYTGLSFVSNP